MPTLTVLPAVDSAALAIRRRAELDVARSFAAHLGHTAVAALESGTYSTATGQNVDWSQAVARAVKVKESIPPEAELPQGRHASFPSTEVQVANETTLGASRRLANASSGPLALNFANGVEPGGGFLIGSRAQEECLCRSSALYATLVGDPMYAAHRQRPLPDSSDWAILSPQVPVFRTDDGESLPEPWLLDFITCTAPVAHKVGVDASAALLKARIGRVLSIARAYEYDTLVLGAWGCGAFGSDPGRTAEDFREALEGEFAGVFKHVVFAITDWSPDLASWGRSGTCSKGLRLDYWWVGGLVGPRQRLQAELL